MSRTLIQSSNDDQFGGKRSGIHGLIAAFGPNQPLIIGVEGEEHIIREPIIVTPSEMTRMQH